MAYKNKEDKIANSKRYYLGNKEKINANGKQWRKDNPEKVKQYKQDHKEDKKAYNERYNQDNKEKIKAQQKQYCQDNKEKKKAYNRRYDQDHKEELTAYNIQYTKDRYKTDLKFNLNMRMSGMIRVSLKGNKNGRAWESLTGYTLADLIKRLNDTMPAGYTWQDFLSGELHIDHKIPVSAFNFTRPEHTDFRRCWALSNLRLLPAKENIIKSAKLDRPFQPALKI